MIEWDTRQFGGKVGLYIDIIAYAFISCINHYLKHCVLLPCLYEINLFQIKYIYNCIVPCLGTVCPLILLIDTVALQPPR